MDIFEIKRFIEKIIKDGKKKKRSSKNIKLAIQEYALTLQEQGLIFDDDYLLITNIVLKVDDILEGRKTYDEVFIKTLHDSRTLDFKKKEEKPKVKEKVKEIEYTPVVSCTKSSRYQSTPRCGVSSYSSGCGKTSSDPSPRCGGSYSYSSSCGSSSYRSSSRC